MNFSKKGSRSFAALLTTIAVTCTATTTVLANGTEQLGDRDIPIASGSGFVCAGTGLGGPILGLVNSATALQGSVPGTIDIDVPAGASIQQVLLYWQGTQSTSRGAGRMDTITLNPGGQVTGQRIGGPILFFTIPIDGWASSYRADITGLNIIQPGSNSIDVCCTDFDVANNGAGIVVIYDDGSGASNIQIADGCDSAFVNFPPPRDTTAPVTFNFAPSEVDRTANLCLFVGSVAFRAGGNRPTIIRVSVDGVQVEQFNDALNDVDGPEWDTFQAPIPVAAGATSLTVQIFSEDSGVGPFAGGLPASFIWVTATFSIGEQQPCTGRIGDFIWNDLNGNGIQDSGEPGLPGVTVRLFEKLDNGGLQQVGQTTTNAAASYLFSDLCAGNYRVQVVQDTLPPNFEASPPNQGDDDTKDSDCEGGAAQVTLPTDSTIDLTVDCGFVRKGACCLDDGRCVRVTQINCNEQGGAYQGDGTTCDQVECPFRKGACCFVTARAPWSTRSRASTRRATTRATAANCATAECPQPQGACCLESGDCVQATQAGCNAQGGDWQGPGTNCKAADCVVIKGACCLADGSCTVVTLDACIGLGGAYEGDNTTCQSVNCPVGNGACCLGDGSCVEVTQAQCNAMLAAYQGNGTGCAGVNCVETKGVCCFADGSCAVETLAECIAMSGAYQGDGTTCQSVNCPAPDGACCFEDGSCQELTQSACNGAGGSYQGNDSRCDGANCVVLKGACCFADGSCAAETLEACIAQGGAYQGDNTTCQSANCPIPDGACCFDDGSCLTLSQSLCNADGGAYQGNDTALQRHRLPPDEGRVLLRRWLVLGDHAGCVHPAERCVPG